MEVSLCEVLRNATVFPVATLDNTNFSSCECLRCLKCTRMAHMGRKPPRRQAAWLPAAGGARQNRTRLLAVRRAGFHKRFAGRESVKTARCCSVIHPSACAAPSAGTFSRYDPPAAACAFSGRFIAGHQLATGPIYERKVNGIAAIVPSGCIILSYRAMERRASVRTYKALCLIEAAHRAFLKSITVFGPMRWHAAGRR